MQPETYAPERRASPAPGRSPCGDDRTRTDDPLLAKHPWPSAVLMPIFARSDGERRDEVIVCEVSAVEPADSHRRPVAAEPREGSSSHVSKRLAGSALHLNDDRAFECCAAPAFLQHYH